MAEKLAHRGPDDAGVWIDAESGVALGHRRLTVVDLSSAENGGDKLVHGRGGISQPRAE